RPRLSRALAMAAGLVLCLVSGWQNAVRIPAMRAQIHALETPRVLSAIVLAPSARAGAGRAIEASADAVIQVTLAAGAAPGAGPYECRLESGSGAVLWRAPVSSFDSDGNVSVQLTASGFSSGSYAWVVSGDGGRREIERYRFDLRRD